MLSFSSFPSCSSLPCFSLPPVISVAPALVSLPVLLTHRLPCIAHRQRTVSARHFATRGLGPAWGGHQRDGQGGVLQGIAAVKTPRLTFPSHMVFCGRQKNHLPLFTSPSCLIYTDPAQRESSSEVIFEFRGLVGNEEAMWLLSFVHYHEERAQSSSNDILRA